MRGRGAEVGVRAAPWMVRLCGAALGFALYWTADALGVWAIVGVSGWSMRLLLLALGAVLAPTRAGSLLWVLVGAMALLGCLVSFTPLVAPMAPWFVRRDVARAGTPPPEAVVVLSGGLTDEGRVTGPALDRLLSGIAEARARRIGTLALSVTVQAHGVGGRAVRISSERDQRALVALIAPELELRLVRDVYSTRDEALAFTALARTYRWRRVVLVTSPLHSRRSCGAFEAAGLAVDCVPAAARDYALTRLDKAENRRLAFADVVYESTATLLYAVRGWLPSH